jgi:PAS domain S-box-containing protein
VDLTEAEMREPGVRAPQQDLRLMEMIDGIVWEADYPMRFTFVSVQAERILGFAPQQWLRDPEFWEKHIHHEDRERVLQERGRAVRKPAPHVLQYRMVTASRRIIWVRDSAVIIAGGPGWSRMCGIITDITDVEQTQDQLKRANESLEAAVAERTAKMEQSVQAMETLCYGIAHDLKAPLRGLQGFISILATDYEKVFDETAKAYTRRCQAALRRMAELIEAVLAYGRLNHTLPELIPISTKALIDRVLQSFEPDIAEKKARVQVQMTLPNVMGNPYLLEQVFSNLITNALKFAKPDTPPEISISGTQIDSEPWARLSVTDNGIGIAPEFYKRMFGMFQKLHRSDQYAGTGIGLAVVKRAVELMNGQVGVFSEPGHGSTFWIDLPSALD